VLLFRHHAEPGSFQHRSCRFERGRARRETRCSTNGKRPGSSAGTHDAGPGTCDRPSTDGARSRPTESDADRTARATGAGRSSRSGSGTAAPAHR
jgi:hypothetical protein